jgi:hypothetical protein
MDDNESHCMRKRHQMLKHTHQDTIVVDSSSKHHKLITCYDFWKNNIINLIFFDTIDIPVIYRWHIKIIELYWPTIKFQIFTVVVCKFLRHRRFGSSCRSVAVVLLILCLSVPWIETSLRKRELFIYQTNKQNPLPTYEHTIYIFRTAIEIYTNAFSMTLRLLQLFATSALPVFS